MIPALLPIAGLLGKPKAAGIVAGLAVLAGFLAVSGWLWVSRETARADAREARSEAREARSEAREARSEAEGYRKALEDHRKATKAQAEAVSRLVTESQDRSEAAARALAQASSLGAVLDRRIGQIRAETLPAGADPCRAAESAFRAELARERGGK